MKTSFAVYVFHVITLSSVLLFAACGNDSATESVTHEPSSAQTPISADSSAVTDLTTSAPTSTNAPGLPDGLPFTGMSYEEYIKLQDMYLDAVRGPDDDLREYLSRIADAEIRFTLSAHEQAHDNEWASLLVDDFGPVQEDAPLLEQERFLAFARAFPNSRDLSERIFSYFLFPDIKDMLEDPLYTQENVLISVAGDREANVSIGIAKCLSQSPVILFGEPRTVSRNISAHAWVFFKYHEYAHHLLGHVSCSARGGLSQEEEHKEEYDADCLAGKILRHRYPQRWSNITTAMWTKLDYKVGRREGRESSTHPSFEARKDTLDKYANEGFVSCGAGKDIDIAGLIRSAG